MKKYLTKSYLPAMLGATIEYYEIALYGFMAPILTPIFLPFLKNTTAYSLYFLFELLASSSQIAGAKFFGKLGDQFGRKKTLFYSMIGTSFSTFLFAILPTYSSIGYLSPILFFLIRCAQSFFLGGEYNGGAIYCLEHENNPKNHGFLSGLYCAFTASGIILASFVSTTLIFFNQNYFRLAYAISLLLALITYKLRSHLLETPTYIQQHTSSHHHHPTPLAPNLLALFFASSFFSVLYGLPTRIFNALLPIATPINTKTIMTINTSFLILYTILLPTFGKLSDKFSPKKIILIALNSTILLSIPIFLLLKTPSVFSILCAKFVFTLVTAAFIAPFHSWAQSLFPPHHRYQYISTYYASGKFLSTILLSSSFLLFQKYHSLLPISSILILSAFLSKFTILYYEKSTQ